MNLECLTLILFLSFAYCSGLYVPPFFFPCGVDGGDTMVPVGEDNCDEPVNIPYEIFNHRTLYVSLKNTQLGADNM